MTIEDIQTLFATYKAATLKHRYITATDIEPLLTELEGVAKIEIVGQSVLKTPIHSITIGNGSKKILMWSQMHGNESTTTKALFDLLNLCTATSQELDTVLKACTLCIIPLLNPDGAKAYTRVNANAVDLNRDAQERTQPESNVLRSVFETFKPHFCYNLHGQRTIFSAGNTAKPAIVSFLAPAQDKACTVTPTRKIAMEVIAEMNRNLQLVIPDQVGVYDDAFNINCVGDTFQSENVPTILFEAGHYGNDYNREYTRELIFISYITSLNYIASRTVTGANYAPYLDIPENGKLFFDVIIRQAKLSSGSSITDVAFQFEERLIDGELHFTPIVRKIGELSGYYGHKEIDAQSHLLTGADTKQLALDSENVCVHINTKKIVLFSK